MKIMIIGYSGSGKSTLAKTLSSYYRIPTLHLDQLQFLPNWQVRPQKDFDYDLSQFLENHNDWVIDGNYSQSFYTERLEAADIIIWMNFPRLTSLWRAIKRSRQFKNQTRDSMADGCIEKLDWEFIRWILWDGRQKQLNRYKTICNMYPEKTVVLKNQKEIDQFLENIKKGISPVNQS